MNKSRIKNIGWRIDYFLISNKLLNELNKNNKNKWNSDILTDIKGSDHAPVIFTF